MKDLIQNVVYQMYRNRDLDTAKFKSSIDGITETCLREIEEHPELAVTLTDSESTLRFFVEQMILESWLLHKELLEKLTGKALYPPEGVEKGGKLYEAYHEGIIEHEVKDIFVCIETDKGNVMASGVGENFFTSISGAINAIEKANAEQKIYVAIFNSFGQSHSLLQTYSDLLKTRFNKPCEVSLVAECTLCFEGLDGAEISSLMESTGADYNYSYESAEDAWKTEE